MKYIEAFDKYVKLLEENGFKDAASDILLLIYEIFDLDFSKWTMYKYETIKDISRASTLSNFPSFLSAMAIAPEPVHTSRIFLFLSPRFKTSSTNTSVSNLGISTFSSTYSGNPQK